MLGQLAGKVQPYSSLDFTAGDGVLLVVVGQAGGFGGNALKDIIHEGVHDAHGLGGDAGVGVHLLQHLVDVDGVALLAALPPLLGVSPSGLGFGCRLLLSLLRGYFARHSCFRIVWNFSQKKPRNLKVMLFRRSRDLLCWPRGLLVEDHLAKNQ